MRGCALHRERLKYLAVRAFTKVAFFVSDGSCLNPFSVYRSASIFLEVNNFVFS